MSFPWLHQKISLRASIVAIGVAIAVTMSSCKSVYSFTSTKSMGTLQRFVGFTLSRTRWSMSTSEPCKRSSS